MTDPTDNDEPTTPDLPANSSTRMINHKGVMRPASEVPGLLQWNARWHRAGCTCGEWHEQDSPDLQMQRMQSGPYPHPLVQLAGHRRGCWCGEWHEKGVSGNELGNLPKSFTQKKFLSRLREVLDEEAEDGQPRLAKVVRNLVRIASSQDEKRSEATVRAIDLILNRIDGPIPKSKEELDASGVKIILVNNNLPAPVAPTPQKLEPVFLEPKFLEAPEDE